MVPVIRFYLGKQSVQGDKYYVGSGHLVKNGNCNSENQLFRRGIYHPVYVDEQLVPGEWR